MTISAHDFKDLDLDGLPSLKSFDEDRARCLWLLWVASTKLNVPAMTPAQMSDVFRDAFSIWISRQRIQSLMAAERRSRTVALRRVDGRQGYQIMQAGIDEVVQASADVLFIEPDKSLSRIRQVEDLLGSRTGIVRVCDPYVDGRTLDFLAECKQASEIRLLSVNIKTRTTFERDLKAFRREHSVPIEVRVVPRGTLHDRYVIDDNGLLLFGTSLNGLGAKQSFVVAAGPDVKTIVLSAFDKEWSAAAVV